MHRTRTTGTSTHLDPQRSDRLVPHSATRKPPASTGSRSRTAGRDRPAGPRAACPVTRCAAITHVSAGAATWIADEVADKCPARPAPAWGTACALASDPESLAMAGPTRLGRTDPRLGRRRRRLRPPRPERLRQRLHHRCPAIAHHGQCTPFRSAIETAMAMLAYLAHTGSMTVEHTELSVSQARDRFSDAVNRAAFGGEITDVTRGRGHSRAAAIVPADLVEAYESLIDQEDGAIASRRLADIDAGRGQVIPADEVAHDLGL